MAAVTVSLQRRLRQKALMLMVAIFLVVVLLSVFFIDTLTQAAKQKNLALKHQVVEQAFNAYLARAEDEMKFIGQDLSSSDSIAGRELDLLFSHHEVLFFGGLDFFYIEWANGNYSMDPRARLFTKADFKTVIGAGLLNRWASVKTEDGATLLVLKTKLLSEEQDSTGFLYGFISLNDNLTLANELLDSAVVSAVRIYDVSHNRVLLEEHKAGVDLSANSLRSSLPLISPIQDNLQLDVIEANSISSAIFTNALPLILSVGVALLVFYFLLVRQMKVLIFQPIETVVYKQEEELIPYIELQPIQRQSRQLMAEIEAKDKRFLLLSDSVHSAVIFCNEVAEVELVNVEARHIFPNSVKARTLFDFMPITSHRSIQDALKGNIGITFDLTLTELGRIYQWHAYTFRNESDYRGLLLVGKDITQETSLTWQLEQLSPLSSLIERKVDTDAILNELSYLSQLPSHIESSHLKGWITLLLSVLDGIGQQDQDVSYLPLGDVFRQESDCVMAAMGIEATRALVDCSVETGSKVVAVGVHFRGLVRTLLMMVMSNDMAERRLSIRFNSDMELEIIAMNDMAFRPLFFWMIKMLSESLGGHKKTLQNNALQLNIMMDVNEAGEDALSLQANQVIAWIANDYPYACVVTEALQRFGLKVEEYASTDSFFTQSNVLTKFDAVLIGCDKDVQSQIDMTLALKLKHKRDHLPIIWLNSQTPSQIDDSVYTLQGCFFDYNLYQVLLKACEEDGISIANHNEQEVCWVMVGGSRVTKAIWYNELEQCTIATQWLSDLADYDLVLSYQPNAIIVLLEPQSSAVILAAQTAFPNVRFYSVQKWPDMPDNVILFDLVSPNSGEQIRFFTQDVMQHNTNSRSNE
ncbi:MULTISPECIES: hypothetical protein [Marinomonas]|uniref:Uncharacterized protein n=1 Tax=Marinomonas alcarazii TaxID=491949 RepID=A0A318UU55_9GAMM|nr:MULTISPECIES: hypothetical protein [Marinomonas]PYF78880.1 hypothetical protein DFP75_11010 [Marinomonas alcarazii]